WSRCAASGSISTGRGAPRPRRSRISESQEAGMSTASSTGAGEASVVFTPRIIKTRYDNGPLRRFAAGACPRRPRRDRPLPGYHGPMLQQALSQRSGPIDGAHPARSVLRLLARRPWRMLLALLAFSLKEIPLWFLPVVTAAIIDLVSSGGSVRAVLSWFLLAAVLLAQNYPNHILYTRNFMTVVRDTGANLRNALAARLQSLSIGYHTRVSASIVQTKVVRDVENVELMLQQMTHPLMSSTMVLIGAITMTAIAVPQFLPVYALTV